MALITNIKSPGTQHVIQTLDSEELIRDLLLKAIQFSQVPTEIIIKNDKGSEEVILYYDGYFKSAQLYLLIDIDKWDKYKLPKNLSITQSDKKDKEIEIEKGNLVVIGLISPTGKDMEGFTFNSGSSYDDRCFYAIDGNIPKIINCNFKTVARFAVVGNVRIDEKGVMRSDTYYNKLLYKEGKGYYIDWKFGNPVEVLCGNNNKFSYRGPNKVDFRVNVREVRDTEKISYHAWYKKIEFLYPLEKHLEHLILT